MNLDEVTRNVSQMVMMHRVLPSDEGIRYPNDVAKIKAAMNSLGYDASSTDIQAAYEEFSDTEQQACWICFDGNSEWAAKAAMRYLVKPVLERPPVNTLDEREMRSICADGVVPCKCGTMPLGVEYVSDMLDEHGKLDQIGAYVVIECPKCNRAVATETPASVVDHWNSAIFSNQ